MISDPLVGELAAIVGAEHVLSDRGMCASYETDWTRRYSGRARCVVRPAATDELAAVMRACSGHAAPLVVQGGNTGLVGGGVPQDGEVVVSTRRLLELEPVDVAAAQVTVGAGVLVGDLQRHVRAAGLDFGVDLAARDSATVGGLAATNAGGIRVLRNGPMRAQVVGVEVVLADGSVVSRMTGLTKDSTGYDIAGLVVGSEGTLAVISRLRLRLVPPLGNRAVALVGLADVAAAVALVGRCRALGTLAAAEILFEPGLQLVCRHAERSAPFGNRQPVYMLIEVAGSGAVDEGLMALLADADNVADATVATEALDRRGLWQYREAHTESIAAEGVPIKLDVSVPLARFAELIERIPEAVAAVVPTARVIMFGHINEGNVHVNVLDCPERAEPVTEAVLRTVAELGGSISAEHGVGRSKREWLHLTRSAADIALMRSVKRALDPSALLGPGVLFGDS